jgi:hypothetical protein
VSLVSGGEAFQRAVGQVDHFAVYASTGLFGLASLGLAAWIFSRKDF